MNLLGFEYNVSDICKIYINRNVIPYTLEYFDFIYKNKKMTLDINFANEFLQTSAVIDYEYQKISDVVRITNVYIRCSPFFDYISINDTPNRLSKNIKIPKDDFFDIFREIAGIIYHEQNRYDNIDIFDYMMSVQGYLLQIIFPVFMRNVLCKSNWKIQDLYNESNFCSSIFNDAIKLTELNQIRQSIKHQNLKYDFSPSINWIATYGTTKIIEELKKSGIIFISKIINYNIYTIYWCDIDVWDDDDPHFKKNIIAIRKINCHAGCMCCSNNLLFW